jgi:NAD(P)-dependent dehydrogenase (short-subunit alcohol dehydrogenase family)
MTVVGNVIARVNVAVITGGAGGADFAVMEQSIGRSMRVVFPAVSTPKLPAPKGRPAESGADVATLVCDTALEKSVVELASYTFTANGIAHLASNDVGIAGMDAEPDQADSPTQELMNEAVASDIAEGIPVDDVAAEVVDAVDANRFWDLADADMREHPVERTQRLATQTNPPMPSDEADTASADGRT